MKKFGKKESISTKTQETIERKMPDELLFKMWQDHNKGDDFIKNSTLDTFIDQIKLLIKENNYPSNCFDEFQKVRGEKYIWILQSPAKRLHITSDNSNPTLSISGSISTIEYNSIDGYTYPYLIVDGEETKGCRYPTRKKVSSYKGNVSSDEELFQFRLFLQENPDTGIICFGNITHPAIISHDVKDLISVGGYINISDNKFESSLSFPELEDIQECFYYTDRSGGENTMASIKRILPKVSNENIEDKCIKLNVLEYQFYEGTEIINNSLSVRVDNHGNPEALHLFFPLFDGIRPDILWFQELLQGIKKISPLYLVLMDKNNIPNNSYYIEHRKHLVYNNLIEAVIKIPKGAISGNNNENYILINKPQANGGIPKDILFMDLTKNFPKDMKKVLATIQDFLAGKLHVSDTHFRAISKHKLKEPFILEPSFYI